MCMQWAEPALSSSTTDLDVQTAGLFNMLPSIDKFHSREYIELFVGWGQNVA